MTRLADLIDWQGRVAAFYALDDKVNGVHGTYHQWEADRYGQPAVDIGPGTAGGAHYDDMIESAQEAAPPNVGFQYTVPPYNDFDPFGS